MKKINWRYAIGELIIVTVGISLAFALNSWAETNREEAKTEIYLDGILTDLKDDRVLIDSTITETEKRLKLLYSMFPYLNGMTAGRDTVILKFFGVIDPLLVQPHESTIQTMLRSGDLSLIQDVKFKNELIEHYDNYRELENEYKRHETFSKEFIAAYFMENMDYGSMRTNMDYSFLADRYFKNIVYSLLGIYRLSLDKQLAAKSRLEKIIPMVEKRKNKLNA